MTSRVEMLTYCLHFRIRIRCKWISNVLLVLQQKTLRCVNVILVGHLELLVTELKVTNIGAQMIGL
jgi:hypothetical protein